MNLYICLFSMGFLFILSIVCFFSSIYFIMNMISIFMEWELFTLNSSSLLMTILLDWMSLMFLSFVLLISSMVIFYSNSYMSSDLNMVRFILLVLMFVFSMILLIISPNLISILLGWDGLGLVSYCLVIYYQNVKSYNSGMLTVLSNRIGDVMILMSIVWMLNYGGWNYIFYMSFMKNDLYMYIIGWFIVLAAMTKSAQIPFSSWLPAAMAAPTPVSALVHSSTLVTAGVYLLIRFNFVLNDTLVFKGFLLIAGLTMFMSGIVANYEFDLKKIIALSTLSQLGLMMSILSMGGYDLAFFHLLTHALFKSLLFMCAGIIIHTMNNNQDIRYMGNLIKFMPFSSFCLVVSNLALCGMPFLAGFYSKDLILEVVLLSNLNILIFFLYFFSTGLTVCYTVRLVYYSLMGDLKMPSLMNLFEEYSDMILSMLFLSFMSVIGGSMLMWLIFPVPVMIYLPLLLKLSILMVMFMGVLMGLIILLSVKFMKNLMSFYLMKMFFSEMWFLPNLSTFGLNYYFLNKMVVYGKVLDGGWSEYLVSLNIKKLVLFSMKNFQLIQNNSFKTYIFIFYFWLLSFMLLFFMKI
uniref:NADH dehydrogenase subunit 5 n=1 Tax=Apsilochorema hwangi TaxID=259356 RepID=UPI0022DCDD90|nr:NADH dehydrogenase subunit 5 [Apsilochorema hwangi]UZZ43786.1 NADH dehydrogenase subunit 5 [Apsilochorema hwangi]